MARRAMRGGASAAPIELLEDRRLMSVSQDALGFTVVETEGDSRKIYVSSSTGSNGNNGLSPNSPVKTVAAGKLLLRNNSGDQLLLKRGDSFNEALGYWRLGGKSVDEPLVIGTYGEGARPTLNTGTAFGITLGQRGSALNNITIQGIRFYSDAHDPGSPTFNDSVRPDGVSIAGNVNNFFVEDASFEHYRNNLVIQDFYGPIQSVTLRRSNIEYSYSDTEAHSAGIYVSGVNGLLFEGNTFHHNGWDLRDSGGVDTIYNHGAYVTATNRNFVAVGNTFSTSASHGLQARAGGIVRNNTFIDNATGMSYGLVNGAGPQTVGGVTGDVTGNVFIGGRDIAGANRGVGIIVGNIKPGAGAVIKDNVFTHGATDGGYAAINLSYGDGVYSGDAVGLNDLTITENVVYKWGTGLYVVGGINPGGTTNKSFNNLTVTKNDFQNVYANNLITHSASYRAGNETWADNRYSGGGNAALHLTGRNYNVAGWQSVIEPTAAATTAGYNGSLSAERSVETFSISNSGEGTIADFAAKAGANTRSGIAAGLPGAYNAEYTGARLAAYLKAGFLDGAAGPISSADILATDAPAPVTRGTPAEGSLPTPTPTPTSPTPTPTTPTPTPTTPTPTPTPTPIPDPTSSYWNVRLNIVAPYTGRVIGQLVNGATISLATLPAGATIQGETQAEGLVFFYDLQEQKHEVYVPLVMSGDVKGAPNPFNFAVGEHRIGVVPFASNQDTWDRRNPGPVTTVNFTIVP